MVRKVLTIDIKQSATNAARLMSKFGVSSLIVSSEEDIVGIVTERDILTRVVASGQDASLVEIEEIMSEPVIVVNPDVPLEEAVKIMFRERIKKLPVMSKEESKLKLIGIVSITDIARIQPKLIESMRSLMDQADMALGEHVNFYIR
jgi:CBS domain-containing protein